MPLSLSNKHTYVKSDTAYFQYSQSKQYSLTFSSHTVDLIFQDILQVTKPRNENNSSCYMKYKKVTFILSAWTWMLPMEYFHFFHRYYFYYCSNIVSKAVMRQSWCLLSTVVECCEAHICISPILKDYTEGLMWILYIHLQWKSCGIKV